MSEKNIKSFIDELIKEVEDELDEANVTGNVDGYDTPHAFSGKNSDKKRKKTATQFGYTLVNNDINNIDESINEDTKRVNILGIDFNISEMNGRIFFSFITFLIHCFFMLIPFIPSSIFLNIFFLCFADVLSFTI